jgi:transposase InsO family protein
VADGHVIKCSVTGKIRLSMYDDNGNVLDAVLHDVMYVPGLSRRLFSITRFARHGHYATIRSGSTTLYFGEQQSPVTLTNDGSRAMAADVTVVAENPHHAIPYHRSHDHSANKKRTSLELLHQRLGHRKCRALLAASEHGVWADTLVRMGPEEECVSCDISTARASNHNKDAHTGGLYPGEYVFLDILHPLVPVGLTRDSTYAFSLILVDAYSRYACIYGMLDKSSRCVIDTLLRYQADHGHIGNYGYLDIARIRADSGTQFTSQEFKVHCWQAGIALSLAAPKKQYQNHLAERSWQTIGNMARSLLVHARLPDSFMHHALAYSCHIFNVLPIKGLYSDGHVSTPFEMFQGIKPRIGHLRVFGCPITARHWVSAQHTNGKETQQGIRGIFIGLAENQKGYLFYSPASRQIYISGDITFDEHFSSTIATTWRPHRDNLALRPVASYIPTASTTLEQTGDVFVTLPSVVEEGEIAPTNASTQSDNDNGITPTNASTQSDNDDDDNNDLPPADNTDICHHNDDDDCPDLASRHDDDSVSEASDWDHDDLEDDNTDDIIHDQAILDLVHPTPNQEEEITPQPANISRYGRV